MGSTGTFRSLEIDVLSAEKLRLDGKSVKKDTFVVVRVDPVNYKSTKADHQGGSNPSWNEKLEIDMSMHVHFITLEVQCKVGSGNRVIGIASIPVSDFMGGYAPENYLHFLSYRLRDLRGEKNGIINVSVKVKGAAHIVIPAGRKDLPAGYTSSPSSSGFGLSQPTWGVPARQNNFYDGGVVTGVPVPVPVWRQKESQQFRIK
ncbi:BON1-associated protein 2 isoform X1 [Ricinus communis]|uniref:BON1-associated protein 2 isoform X1 n=1 Tax=Ricinus communis TaxID=3988 RepID=UPI00201AAFD1|nr:BON1-associated protein 2 isoform X1 [Ricinus communis]